ncbi:Noc2-domain-containing protein [Meredithblackwellia eburnea MCA 4105]
MAKSKAKQTKTFLKKNLLEGQIKNRHKAREFKRKVQARQVKRNKGRDDPNQKGKHVEEEEEDENAPPAAKDEDSEDEVDLDDVLEGKGLGSDEEVDGNDDDEAVLSDDDLSGLDSDPDTEGSVSLEQHAAELKALADKDPEFYKYLQENDAELLDFAGENGGDSDEDEDDVEVDSDEEMEDLKDKQSKKGKGKDLKTRSTPVLTLEMLRGWQKSILEVRSISALRKLLLAFRSAASSGAETEQEGSELYEIRSAEVFNKVIVTTLKYTPVVLTHVVPFKEKDGKYKLSTNSKEFRTAIRLIRSYFVSLQSLLDSVASDSGIPAMAAQESAKLVPWVVSDRKVARGWLKLLLSVYESAADDVRVAAFVALRKLAIASDHSLRESVLKGVYSSLLASFKSTSAYSLPSLNLMKNSASTLFVLPGKQSAELSYQLAFTYIRMLAILLRKGVKESSKESFKSVYNWQFVHAVDFWSLVLSEASDQEREVEQGESPLKQLLYPLIQVVVGAIRLVPTARYFPLRFHLVRSLLRVVQRTGTYIPISTYMFEVLDSPDLNRRAKPSTLKPLDWEYFIRCPASYLKTRVYAEGLAEEAVYVLTEYYSTLSLSIGFPELVLPAIVSLKRHGKKSGNQKLTGMIKSLVEKLEGNSKWIEERREKIEFTPSKRDKVDRFLKGDNIESTPLGAHLKLMNRVREQKRLTLEKAARGDGEDL